MVDKESFDYHKLSLIREIEFQVRKKKLTLDIDSINNAVNNHYKLYEEELSESGIPISLLLSEVRSNFQIKLKRKENFVNIDNVNHEPWYFENEKSNRPFWDRYYKELTEGSMPKFSRDALDRHTDGIISRCENPKSSDREWQTKALVLGSVQQGKTSNYIGLTCKAADAGYKLFIILTGMFDDLRTQTQIRFDEGFTGYESGPLTEYDETTKTIIGVAKFDPSLNAQSITHRRLKGDVKKNMLNGYNGNAFKSQNEKPHIIVCKKNPGVLRTITEWIDTFPKVNNNPDEKIIPQIPLFIIDDEADQASVDTSTTNSPKRINGQIRRLLNTFTNSCYISYTATAYANLLIDHSSQRSDQTVKEKKKRVVINEEGKKVKEDYEQIKDAGPDLFPKNFITLMPEPDNYVGFEDIFPNENTEDFDEKFIESRRYIRTIDDHYDDDSDGEKGWMPISAHSSKVKNHIPMYEGSEEIPPSLKKAIYTFILSSALKYKRNLSEKHSSMMVHVTYKNAIQDQVREQIDNFVDILKRELHTYNKNNLHWKELKILWDNDINFKKHINNNNNPDGKTISWESIVNTIIFPDKDSVIDRLETIQLSGSSADILDYDSYEKKGAVLIVLGGTKLSRGLTLRGLCVSYFARYAARRLADTLTQMARWFGYRDGYKDICRVYLTDTAYEAFSEFSFLDYDTRSQAEALDNRPDLTPDKVLITLQSTPGSLVTNKLKMQAGIVQKLNLTAKSSSVRSIYTSQNKKNKEAVEAFLNNIAKAEPDYINDRRTKFNVEKLNELKKYDLIWKTTHNEVSKFLSEYTFASSNLKIQQGTWERYIKLKCDSCQELVNWNIILKGRGEGTEKTFTLKDYTIIPGIRTDRIDNKTKATKKGKIDIGTLFTSQDCKTILSKDEYEHAMAGLANDSKLTMDLAINAYSMGKRNQELEGFLFIGPVVTENNKDSEVLYPIAIVFPHSEREESIEVTINKATVNSLKKDFGEDGDSDEEFPDGIED